MVTPFSEEHKDLPRNIRTRMILTLASTVDFNKLVEDFSDPDHFPDSLLMFLSQLKRLNINIYNNNGHVSKTTYSYRYDETDRQATLTKSSSVDDRRREETKYYHITKRTLQNLPKDRLRPDRNRAEVVLAFPVDAESIPIIQRQHVFAYLPVRQVGFSVSRTTILR